MRFRHPKFIAVGKIFLDAADVGLGLLHDEQI
jgi:hypothetical protein